METNSTPAEPRKTGPGLDFTEEDGKPTEWSIRSFEESCAFIESDTKPATLEKLKPQIDAIKESFRNGDVGKLLDVASKTAPVAYKSSEYGLGDAQVLNDFATLALNSLLGEDAIRPLTYNYQSHLGQSTSEIVGDRLVAAGGEYGKEAKDAALAEIAARNPEDEQVLLRQRAAVQSIQDMLGERVVD